MDLLLLLLLLNNNNNSLFFHIMITVIYVIYNLSNFMYILVFWCLIFT